MRRKKFCGYRSFKETIHINWVTDRYLIKRYEKDQRLGRPRVGATEQLPIPRELRRPRSHRAVGELFLYVLLVVLILCLLCVRNLWFVIFLFLFSASTLERTWAPLMGIERRGAHFLLTLSPSYLPPLLALLLL